MELKLPEEDRGKFNSLVARYLARTCRQINSHVVDMENVLGNHSVAYPSNQHLDRRQPAGRMPVRDKKLYQKQ